MDFEKVNLNMTLEDCISDYYINLKERNIIPNIFITDKKIERNLNKNALYRILGNIINNAIKYSDGDLNISLTEEGEFIFSNSAKNLSEIDLGKLFNKFYTVENGKKSTGLGLSITKYLTEKMNGRIKAKYYEGKIIIKIKF